MYPPFGPIFFQLGPLTVRWYGVIMVIAILISCWIASRYVVRHGQDSTTIWDMLLWVLIPALIGERLYYLFIGNFFKQLLPLMCKPGDIEFIQSSFAARLSHLCSMVGIIKQ